MQGYGRVWVVATAVAAMVAVLPAAASAESLVYLRGIYWSNSNYEPDQIWRAGSDGSNPQPVLQQSQTVLHDPVLSPSGRTVAFVRSCASGCGGVSLVDISGANERMIVPDGAAGTTWMRPSFHPDGQSLLITKRVIGTHPTYIDKFSLWRVNLDGSGLAPVISWSDASGPHQLDGVYSPDGSKIAFTSHITPAGVREPGQTLWTANADGSNPTQLTTVPGDLPPYNEGRTFGGRPAWSADGTQLAFTWEKYTSTSTFGWSTEIGVISASGGSPTLITATQDLYEYAPSWSTQGRIAYSRARSKDYGNSMKEIRTMDAGGGGDTAIVSDDAYGFHEPSFGTTAPLTNAELVSKYLPILRYDESENYYADSAAEMTDNCVLDSRGRILRQNLLKNGSGTVLAAACPGDKKPDLSLTYLGGILSSTSDQIDAPNTYLEDAQRLHGNTAYANKTYARTFEYADGSKVLQYWFFYYYNPKQYPPVVGVGEHEGDWEMVQVHLDPAQTPTRATYSQHGSGERCDWINVQRLSGRPIVYVAEGSHANYFSSGFHAASADTAGGNGVVASPGIIHIVPTPMWFNWQGRWGGSASSPPGPKQQGGSKWNDPVTWSDGVHSCTEEQTQPGATAASRHRRPQYDGVPAPPAPKVVAARTGDEVKIRYSFGGLPNGSRRPGMLVAAVDPRGATPISDRWRVRGRHGVVRMPLGAGEAPYRITVRAIARSGRRSAPARVELR